MTALLDNPRRIREGLSPSVTPTGGASTADVTVTCTVVAWPGKADVNASFVPADAVAP